jgi:hypothetical protein
MSHNWRMTLLVVLGAGMALPAGADDRKSVVVVPRLVSVAETKLIMEGMTLPNYRGLETQLQKKPADAEGWTFVRGQALLVAESGNLLMLRPPKNQGQDAWMRLAADLRDRATDVARQAANRNYEKAVNSVGDLTAACNRCHQTFQVPVRVGQAEEERKQ